MRGYTDHDLEIQKLQEKIRDMETKYQELRVECDSRGRRIAALCEIIDGKTEPYDREKAIKEAKARIQEFYDQVGGEEEAEKIIKQNQDNFGGHEG